MRDFVITYPVVSIITGLTLLAAMVLSNVAIMAPFWFSEKLLAASRR